MSNNHGVGCGRFCILFLFWSLSNFILVAECRYFNSFDLLPNDMYLQAIDTNSVSLFVEARLAVSQNKECNGRSKSKWSLVWNYQSAQNYNGIEITWQNTDFGDLLDRRQALITVYEVRDGEMVNIKTIEKEDGVNMSLGYNSVIIEADANDNFYNVFVGDNKLIHIGTFDFTDAISGSCGVVSTEQANVMNFIIESIHDLKSELKTNYTYHSLKEKFSTSKAMHEGFWSYLDRDIDPDWSRIGGRYQLALVEDGEDFIIIYIAGAETNSKYWQEGMIKGRLNATIFKDHYDLIWYDSMFDAIEIDAHASIKDSILTLEFPLYKATMRFYKHQNN